jgi:phosphosulfolactate phosphohydrolase-like enzyme
LKRRTRAFTTAVAFSRGAAKIVFVAEVDKALAIPHMMDRVYV